MDAAQIDKILHNRLLLDAAEAIEAIGLELETLYDYWASMGASPDALRWLWGVLERLGWWAGRVENATDRAAAAGFPVFEA